MSTNIDTPQEAGHAVCDRITAQLDEFEQSWPPFPAAWLRLNRAIAERIGSTAGAVASRLNEEFGRVSDDAGTAAATVGGQARSGVERVSDTVSRTAKETVGQARSGVERVAETAQRTAKQTVGQARSGVERVAETAEQAGKETTGQVRAQAERVVDDATSTATDLVTEAEQTVSPTKAELDSMTKAELYDRAQDLDIDGRSTMDKAELVDAIAAAEG